MPRDAGLDAGRNVKGFIMNNAIRKARKKPAGTGAGKTAAGKKTALWPRPRVKLAEQPHFLFLVTPPNSGSTAMAKMLNSSHRTILLNHNGEAQWLVPGLNGKNRWDPAMEVDYESVKAVWLKQFEFLRACAGNVDVVIEKSPASLPRFDRIRALFDDTSVIASNRNPYANICSKGYRYANFANRPPAERAERVAILARKWQDQSRMIAGVIDRHNCPLVTYETFCADPARLIAALALPAGVAETIDTGASVLVKDYADQGVVNQNPKQIALLSAEEKAVIREVLATDMPLLERFGYGLDADAA